MTEQTQIQPTCGARTRNGGSCKNAPMLNGSGRCRMHGGKSLRGLEHPNFKTGGWSKDLPARLVERYNESLEDPELLNLRRDISLIDSRLADVLKRVDSGENGEIWRNLQAIFGDLSDAKKAGDAVKFGEALGLIGSLITDGLGDWAAWDEIGKLLEQRRRLVESERKRLVEMQETITTERALLLINRLAVIIKKHVSDRAVLSAISADLREILHGGG